MAYQSRMPARLLRGFLALLIVSAYLGATVLAVAPIANAASADMNHGMMHEPGVTGDEMPCKGTVPGCVTEFGCIFLVSLPAPDLTISAMVGWSPVTYLVAGGFLRGRSTKPALDPPISRA